MNKAVEISLSPSRILAALLVTIATLAALHVVDMFIHYRIIELHFLIRDLFDLNEEQSFGTWFSAVLLLATGVLLFAASGQSAETRTSPVFWRLLGLGFCLLSLDEVVGLHESLNTAVDFSWTLPGMIVAGLAGLAFVPFVFSLPAKTRWLFILAGAIYLSGAIGMEKIGEEFGQRDLFDTLEYGLLTAFEELLEMTGVAVMAYAVLDYLADPSEARVRMALRVA